MMQDIIIKNISKSFGEKQVLSDFSAVLPRGKCSVIRGASGSGKTTVGNILLGLVTPDSGEIQNLPALCAAVFQEDRLCESFSVLSNLRFAVGSKVPREELLACLRALGIADRADSPVSGLSGGMKRRVAIARALMSEFDLLILDEPFKGLDEDAIRAAAAEIKKRTEGKTVLLITHSSFEGEIMGDGVEVNL